MKGSDVGAKRVLVVEDEPVVCQLCMRVLTREGFKVDVAVNGMMAQDMLWGENYDLVIIDIRMPVMNGKQLYQYINEKYPGVANRVIFTTGDVVGKDTQSFLGLTGRPLLSKPFTPDELKTIVRETFKEIEK